MNRSHRWLCTAVILTAGCGEPSPSPPVSSAAALGAGHAVIEVLIGDIDGFGFSSTTGLLRTTGSAADVDGDGILEPGEYLPDLNQDGKVAYGSGDGFNNSSPDELAASNGAQRTDHAIVGVGSAGAVVFNFTFPVPGPDDADYGKDHYVNFVFGDYDLTPATVFTDGVASTLVAADPQTGGLVQKGYAVVPWASLTDGALVVRFSAPNEQFIVFDYALLSAEPISDGDGDAIPDSQDNCVSVANTPQIDTDGDGVGDSCDACRLDADNDADDDGVCGDADRCPGTQIPEEIPTRTLGTNRWALLNADEVFDTVLPSGTGPGRSYTTADTAGCSCAQIAGALGLGLGQWKSGCSGSTMDSWVQQVSAR